MATTMFAPADRRRTRLRIALSGISGSGKSTAAVNIALALGGRVAVIDTEGGAAEILSPLGNFDVATLEPPYTVGTMLESLEAAIKDGYSTVVIDSLSHVWTQLLHQKSALDSRPNANAFSNWRPISAEYDALIQAILRAPLHVVCTLRSKPSHVQVIENGKAVVKRIGDEAVMRDSFPHEMTVVLDLDRDDHRARAVKDRTGIFEGARTLIDDETGKKLMAWLMGAEPQPREEKKPCVEGQWLKSIISAEQMKEFKSACEAAGQDWKAVSRKAMKVAANDFSSIMAEVSKS